MVGLGSPAHSVRLGSVQEEHGDGFQHHSVVFPEKRVGGLLMSNSDNAESIFGHLFAVTLADPYALGVARVRSVRPEDGPVGLSPVMGCSSLLRKSQFGTIV